MSVSQATAGSPGRRQRVLKRVAAYTTLLAMSGVFVVPLLWMLATSFKTTPDATRLPLSLVPREPSTHGYQELFKSTTEYPVHLWFLNSLIAATGHAVLVLVVTSLAAYPLARMEFFGKRVVFGTIITTLFIPSFIFLVPNYLIVDGLGWLDTFLAIIVPGAAGAFGVFFLRQFFQAIPRELEEAAVIDGANRLQVFLRIILPLTKPALATLAVLSFLTNWNDFLWPIYVLFSPENRTLPPGLATLQGTYITDFPVLMAAAMIASIPVLILFFVAQRYIIEGVARSGLKG